MAKKPTVLLVTVLLAAATILVACKPSEEKSKMNLDTGVVRVDIDGHRFDVPLRYMYSYAVETYGRWPTPKKEVKKVGALNISVLLPDLRPYYKEDEARWRMRGHGDKAEVMIAKFRGPKENWEKGQSMSRELIEKFISEGRFYKKSPDVYDLIHYTDANKEPNDNGDTYFSKNLKLELKCDSIKPPKGSGDFWSPSCKVTSNYGSGLVLEYYYALKYLPQWKEIDDGLKAMFDIFAQTAQAASSNQLGRYIIALTIPAKQYNSAESSSNLNRVQFTVHTLRYK